MKQILITGGAGYIGSHAAVELISAGYAPVVCDDFSNSKPQVLDRIEKITGKLPALARGETVDAASLKHLQAAFFKNVYRMLIGKDKGPRLYLFLFALEKERFLPLLPNG